ncbi:hypothetical protein BJX63DRAFT_416965 [Aspergillus granulosus]|uniref:Uncharacterized protein n=1 Tax=Aspergillus granulosus TaxID=176169 RepID=A0ABR4GRV9_9EURO
MAENLGRKARRSVFLAVTVWFGYFEFPLHIVPFTGETGRKYRLTVFDELGLRN